MSTVPKSFSVERRIRRHYAETPLETGLVPVIVSDENEYKVITQLKWGAYGDVYLAKKRKSDEKVAIKYICFYSENIEEELRASYALQKIGPNIHAAYLGKRKIPHVDDPQLHGVMVMDVWDCEMTDMKKIDNPQFVFDKLFDSIYWMHTQNWWHHDLHLGNVLFKMNQSQVTDVCICDFGLSIHATTKFEPPTIGYFKGWITSTFEDRGKFRKMLQSGLAFFESIDAVLADKKYPKVLQLLLHRPEICDFFPLAQLVDFDTNKNWRKKLDEKGKNWYFIEFHGMKR